MISALVEKYFKEPLNGAVVVNDLVQWPFRKKRCFSNYGLNILGNISGSIANKNNSNENLKKY